MISGLGIGMNKLLVAYSRSNLYVVGGSETKAGALPQGSEKGAESRVIYVNFILMKDNRAPDIAKQMLGTSSSNEEFSRLKATEFCRRCASQPLLLAP